jgi:hypothetical protein
MGPLVGFWLKPGRSVGRVDGIIETCKIVTIILKIHPRPCGTRINNNNNNNNWKTPVYQAGLQDAMQIYTGLSPKYHHKKPNL